MLLWLALWVPPLGSVWQSTLLMQMLVQTGLLIALGFVMGWMLLARYGHRLLALRVWRWALLVVAVFSLSIWMIPRLADASVESGWVLMIRALSLTFLGGLPLCWAWQAMGPVIRGVLHIEALASLFRLGWLYLDSPVRLCTQYVYSDQRMLGLSLLWIALVYLCWLAAVALRGRVLWRLG
ncbi:MAG TPA: hypothetical protein PLQ67_03465 [Burkholderiaceae bacterium]|nr:hypothetical protein [Burkholderiaceae bacterium]